MTTWHEVDHPGRLAITLWNDKFKVMSVISWNEDYEAYVVSIKHPPTQQWISTVSGVDLEEAKQLAESALASVE